MHIYIYVLPVSLRISAQSEVDELDEKVLLCYLRG